MPSIALVVLDTLRKDAFDDEFDWLPGRRFENAWSPSSWTGPVHGSLFTGLYPSEHGFHAKHLALDCETPVLAERLTAEGVTTRAFSSNVYVSWSYGFDRGFDEFRGSWRLQSEREDIYDWGSLGAVIEGEGIDRFVRPGNYRALLDGLTDVARDSRYGLRASLRHALDLELQHHGFAGPSDDGAQAALEYVRDTQFGDGEFLFVNLMEAHAPYNPPPEYRSTDPQFDVGRTSTLTDGDLDPETLRGAYDDCVDYLSDVYRKIFEELSSAFDYVITVSDHGEMFGEHGIFVHPPRLYEELVNVPLIVSGEELDGVVEETVTLLDVHETVCSVQGVTSEGRGRDLRGDLGGRPVLTECHGLNPYVAETVADSGANPALLDSRLAGIATPRDYYGCETGDIDGEPPGGWFERGTVTVEDPREIQAELRADLDQRTFDEDDLAGIDDQSRQQLADLGYI